MSGSTLRIVVPNRTLLTYLKGGGHWTVRLNWLAGLRDLGHEPLLLGLAADRVTDRDIETFFSYLREWDLDKFAVVARSAEDRIDLEKVEYVGGDRTKVLDFVRTADFLFDLCAGAPSSLREQISKTALLDLDPGLLQVSACKVPKVRSKLEVYHRHFTVGLKMADQDCRSPRLDHQWIPFAPPVHLPKWPVVEVPQSAVLSSVTHWTWGEIYHEGERLSTSKRDAYLSYIELPQNVDRQIELAVRFTDIATEDDAGEDPSLLRSYGWRLSDPWRRTSTPANYREFIQHSLGELSCPKPIFRDLRTGWFSDRSACYLASGRPVVAEDTGFSDHLPVGKGLLTFTNTEEAVEMVKEVHANWKEHSKAAREIAETYLDAKRVLAQMITKL